MRLIEDHKVRADDALEIAAIDQPGHGGACHKYVVGGFDDPNQGLMILFQNGPIKENGVNGITQEVLLAVVADRLRSFQAGPYACRANEQALQKVEEALHWLQQRTLERVRRGVEGVSII